MFAKQRLKHLGEMEAIDSLYQKMNEVDAKVASHILETSITKENRIQESETVLELKVENARKDLALGHWMSRQLSMGWNTLRANTVKAAMLVEGIDHHPGVYSTLYISHDGETFELAVEQQAPKELTEALGIADIMRISDEAEASRSCYFRGICIDTHARPELAVASELEWKTRERHYRDYEREAYRDNEAEEERMAFTANEVTIAAQHYHKTTTTNTTIPCEVHFTACGYGHRMYVGGEGNNSSKVTMRLKPKGGLRLPFDQTYGRRRIFNLSVTTKSKTQIATLLDPKLARNLQKNIRSNTREAQKYFGTFRKSGSESYLPRDYKKWGGPILPSCHNTVGPRSPPRDLSLRDELIRTQGTARVTLV